MKVNRLIICCFFSVFLFACNDAPIESEFIAIDVTKSFPVKEILLEDIASIEYILPETNEKYLYKGLPRIITDKWIIFHNFPEGDIIVYDRSGKPYSSFNRQGNGPEEYQMSGNITFDKDREEIYLFSVDNSICTYHLDGTFIRKTPLPENTFIQKICNFDKDHLLYYNKYGTDGSSFVLFSKVEGKTIDEISFPIEKRLNLWEYVTDGEMRMAIASYADYIVPVKEGFILNEFSADTVFIYTSDRKLVPLLTRTPPVQTMQPLTYLNSYLETNPYLFLTSTKMEFNRDTKKFVENGLLIDRKNGGIYRSRVQSKEYKEKEFLLGPHLTAQSIGENTGLLQFTIDELITAYEENRLNGKLKEIASQLDEEANNLLVLLHFK